MLIDTHCHIYKEYYENIEDTLEEISKENIILIINGVDPKSNFEVIEMTKKYPFIYGTLGFHPSEVDNIKESDFEQLEIQLKEEKIVGVGEIGLDYYWRDDNKDKQIEVFKKQLDIAKKYNYPVIIHNREATEDIIKTLKDYNLKGIIHAFSKGIDLANIFIDMGYKIGIGGVVTFKNTKLRDTLKEIDIKNIVLETDSPYLTPEPHRGKVNNPIYLKYIALEIAKTKEIEFEKISDILLNNTLDIFDLKLKK